jgi:hypothetical protein
MLWFLDASVRRGGVNLCIDLWPGWTDEPKATAHGGLFMRASSVPHTLVVTATDDSTVLASTEMTFAVDTQYVVVFTPRNNLIVLFDTVSAPPTGEESFRIVNIASGAVDVYVLTTGSEILASQTPVVSNLTSEAVSPYLSYPAVPTRFFITEAGTPSNVLHDGWFGTSPTEAGKVWTIFFGEMYASGALRLTTLWHKDRN